MSVAHKKRAWHAKLFFCQAVANYLALCFLDFFLCFFFLAFLSALAGAAAVSAGATAGAACTAGATGGAAGAAVWAETAMEKAMVAAESKEISSLFMKKIFRRLNDKIVSPSFVRSAAKRVA